MTIESQLQSDNGLYTAYSVKNKEGKFTPVCSVERAVSVGESEMINFQRWCQRCKYQFDVYSNSYVYMGSAKHEVLTIQEILQKYKSINQ